MDTGSPHHDSGERPKKHCPTGTTAGVPTPAHASSSTAAPPPSLPTTSIMPPKQQQLRSDSAAAAAQGHTPTPPPPIRTPTPDAHQPPDDAMCRVDSGLLVEPDAYIPEAATPPPASARTHSQPAAAAEEPASGHIRRTTDIQVQEDCELDSEDDHPPPSQPTSVITFGRDPDDDGSAEEGAGEVGGSADADAPGSEPEIDADGPGSEPEIDEYPEYGGTSRRWERSASEEMSGDPYRESSSDAGEEEEGAEEGEVAQVLYVTQDEMGEGEAGWGSEDDHPPLMV